MSIVVDFPGGNVYHYKRLRTYEKCTGIQLYNCEYSLDISLVDETTWKQRRTKDMSIFMLGIDHNMAPVDIRAKFAFTKKNAGELYISESGHLEFTYSASAGAALQKAFHAVPGEAFGFMAGSPAAIGLVMADTAMKASAVNITCYMTPSIGTSHSNEVILALSGSADAAKEAVLSARQIGLELLIAMGSYPEIPGTPYL